jgi:hypothetical protein
MSESAFLPRFSSVKKLVGNSKVARDSNAPLNFL